MHAVTIRFAGTIAVLALVAAPSVFAASPASAADKAFVAKVSQGGLYEVEASKVAEMKAHAQNVKDVANTEVHDHSLVNARLKQVATPAGVTFSGQLNPEFTQRLDKLKAVPAAGFDSAYLSDMAQIHDKDQKLFAQEAIDGSGEFKPFAAETDIIVKRHIGMLSVK